MLVPINITLVSINSTLLKVPLSLTLRLILVKLDAFNGLMMTLALSQEVGTVASLCGNSTLTKTQEEKVKSKMETHNLNLN